MTDEGAEVPQVVCAGCGQLNMVPLPVYDRLAKDGPIKCEKCGRVLVKRE